MEQPGYGEMIDGGMRPMFLLRLPCGWSGRRALSPETLKDTRGIAQAQAAKLQCTARGW